MKKVRELEKFIDSRDGVFTEYDEALVRRLIEKVTVYDDQKPHNYGILLL